MPKATLYIHAHELEDTDATVVSYGDTPIDELSPEQYDEMMRAIQHTLDTFPIQIKVIEH